MKHDEERRRILFIGNFAFSSTKTIASGAIRRLQDCPDVALHIVGAHPYDEYGTYPVSTDCDGVITCCRMENPMARGLARRRPAIPFVFVLDPCPWPSLQPRSLSIVCDDRAIAAEAADLFVRHDLREFGYVGSRHEHPNTEWVAARREEFASRLAEHGFSARAYSPTGRSDEEESAALAAWLLALPKPCGLFVAYDQRARRVLEICRAEGISVPEQIQVLGVDNESWICESIRPTLSSIEPDFEGAGYRAAEALLEMMGGARYNEECKMDNAQCEGAAGTKPGPPVPATATFGVRRVVERMSTTDAHGSMSRAVRARNFIQSHVGEPLTVSRVAEQLNCSLRTLQSSYKAVFGTTVWDDIAETRLAMAQKLLSSTDIPIGDIPERVGFKSPRHFARLFKTRTGMSMRQWRKSRGT